MQYKSAWAGVESLWPATGSHWNPRGQMKLSVPEIALRWKFSARGERNVVRTRVGTMYVYACTSMCKGYITSSRIRCVSSIDYESSIRGDKDYVCLRRCWTYESRNSFPWDFWPDLTRMEMVYERVYACACTLIDVIVRNYSSLWKQFACP